MRRYVHANQPHKVWLESRKKFTTVVEKGLSRQTAPALIATIASARHLRNRYRRESAGFTQNQAVGQHVAAQGVAVTLAAEVV